MDWLQLRMDERGISQADLARGSGLSTATISRIMTGGRGIGLDACVAIGSALGVPPEKVFRAAVGLPDRPDGDPHISRLTYLLSKLDNAEKDDLIAMVEALVRRKETRGRLEELRTKLAAVPPEQNTEVLDLIEDWLVQAGVVLPRIER